MPNNNLNEPIKFFRARLVDKGVGVFIWDFTQFGDMIDFYKSIADHFSQASATFIDFTFLRPYTYEIYLLDSIPVNLTRVDDYAKGVRNGVGYKTIRGTPND